MILVPMPGVKSVTGLVMVRSGSRDEAPEQAGISHFLEHIVFKGTKKFPDFFSISSKLDAVGAEHNAFTGKEYTGYYVKAAAEHLKTGIEVLSQVLTEPLLRGEDIEKERGVILEEIKMYEDLPMQKVGSVFDETLYGKNGLGRDTIGTKETVGRLAAADFFAYLRERYSGGRIVVGIAGGIGTDEQAMAAVREMVEAGFGNLAEDRGGEWREIGIDEQNQPRVMIQNKPTEQAHFVLGFPGFYRDDRQRYALAVLSTILGGTMSSRLFSEVRERRGLAYYIRSSVDRYHEAGSLAVQAGVDLGKLGETVRIIAEELSKVTQESGKGSIEASEVAMAKENIKGRLILELEDSEEVADLYARHELLERKIETPQEILAKIEAVGWEDLVGVARQVISGERLNLAVIGPYGEEDRQRFLKLLHF